MNFPIPKWCLVWAAKLLKNFSTSDYNFCYNHFHNNDVISQLLKKKIQVFNTLLFPVSYCQDRGGSNLKTEAVLEIPVSLICHCLCLSTFLVALPLVDMKKPIITDLNQMFFKSWNAQFAQCQRKGSLTRWLTSAGQAENRSRRLRPKLAPCAWMIWSVGLLTEALGLGAAAGAQRKEHRSPRGHGSHLWPPEADVETKM